MALQSAAMARSQSLAGSKYAGNLAKLAARRVLDPLVDRQDRQVAGAGQAAGVVEGAEVAQHGRRAVRVAEDLVEVVGPGQGQVLGRERLGACG